MQKKFLVSLTATATAFSMLVAPSLTAFAEDTEPLTETVTVSASDEPAKEGEITISDGSSAVVANGGTITVDGDITTSGTNGSYKDYVGDEHLTASPTIDADNHATVTVNGNITAGNDGTEQTAIDASNSTIVVNDGNVSATDTAVQAYNSTITINGDIVGGEYGIQASIGNTISVKGNVTAHGMQSDYTRDDVIAGTSTFGSGVSSYGENNIIIDGNINSIENGLDVNVGYSGNQNNGSILVTGDIISGREGLNIYDNGKKSGFATADDFLAATPDITIYSTNFVSVGIQSTDATADVKAEIRSKIKDAINYIIKADSNPDYNIKVSGTNVEKISGFDTVNRNEAFNVAANVPEGYELSGGDHVSVSKNNDGTYTLVLTDSRGGIFVTARLIPVTNSDGSTSYIVESETSNEESSSNANSIPNGAIIVANSQGAADTPSNVAAISGTKPARTVSYSMASITPIQYKESIISNVAAAPQGGAMNIETDRVACLDSKMIAAIASRPDIDVNVVFTYGGKKLKVTIPAGYDVNSLLDEHGYCGFLRLMSILGSTEL